MGISNCLTSLSALILTVSTLSDLYADSHQPVIDNISWVTEQWPSLTEADNSGLYDQIIPEVFSQHDIEVYKTGRSFREAIRLIHDDKADFAGGIVKDQGSDMRHYQAPFPILSTPVSAFYRINQFTQSPTNKDDLIGYRVCSSPQIGLAIGLKLHQYQEKETKREAFLQTAAGKCDVYIDDRNEMRQTISRHYQQAFGNSNLPPYQEFDISYVGTAHWYMITPRTTRGKMIMEFYVVGTQKLMQSGRLEKIYKAHGFDLPDLSSLLRNTKN